MPKPFLRDDDARLERDVIETMLAGLHEWRPDLSYPESHSDMQACVRGLLCMFKLERRPLPAPLPAPLRLRCDTCEGPGKLISLADGVRHIDTCPDCRGKGHVESR
jgi:hypothetical protein